MRPPIEVVAGRYRLLSLLGTGGMGTVWKGEHTSLRTPVAIKLLDARFAERDPLQSRFLREARAAAALRSKHVVQIIDHGVEAGVPYIVMELLRGESLGARLHREKTIDPRTFARIFAETGRAVARAHKAGIIHRDLKPDNIFLTEPEEETASESGPSGQCVVKVVDFGIAKVADEGALPDDLSTDTGTMLGTPHYMSPEQARGLKEIDARTDLWAMGVIAFECLVGRRPFQARALGELVLDICSGPPPVPSTFGQVPAGFDAWFAKAVERDVDRRFQTVEEIVQGLEEILTPGEHRFEVRSATTEEASSLPADIALDETVPAEAMEDARARLAGAAPASAPDPTTESLPAAALPAAPKALVAASAQERSTRATLIRMGLLVLVAVVLAVGWVALKR